MELCCCTQRETKYLHVKELILSHKLHHYLICSQHNQELVFADLGLVSE